MPLPRIAPMTKIAMPMTIFAPLRAVVALSDMLLIQVNRSMSAFLLRADGQRGYLLLVLIAAGVETMEFTSLRSARAVSVRT